MRHTAGSGARGHTPGEQAPPSVLERVGAGVALALMLPLLVMLWVLVRLGLGGPAVVRDYRSGRRTFAAPVLRFRTTTSPPRFRPRAHRNGRPAMPRDRAGRRFGSALGRWGLDQLPALWDVMRGRCDTADPPAVSHCTGGLRLVRDSSPSQPVSRLPSRRSAPREARPAS